MVQHAIEESMIGVAQLLEAAVERLMDPPDYAGFLRCARRGLAPLI
jgi:hypothetical protein